MKPYTVILLYPDYLTSEIAETYTAHVTAENGDAAILLAQDEAACANSDDEAAIYARHFAVIAVFDGHLEQTPWG